MSITAATVIANARSRVDKTNSTFVSDANELVPWCDQGHRQLYDLLITAYGQEYFLNTVDMYVSASTLYSTLATYKTGNIIKTIVNGATVTTTTTIETGTTNFYKLIRFDRSGVETSATVTIVAGAAPVTVSTIINDATPNEVRVPFRPFEFSDQVLSDTPAAWSESGSNVRYRLSGNRIYWHPRPESAQMVRMYYVPLPTAITVTTSVVDTWAEPWSEYVELYVARAIREKEQDTEGVASIAAQMAQVERRIMETAPPRDAGQPQTIVDVQANEWRRCLWPDEVW